MGIYLQNLYLKCRQIDMKYGCRIMQIKCWNRYENWVAASKPTIELNDNEARSYQTKSQLIRELRAFVKKQSDLECWRI